MAAAATGFGVSGNGTWMQHNKKMKSPRGERSIKVTCVASRVDPYKTLRIDRTASESEVRKAFRKLALKYHPDVCRGSNCGVQFHKINEAYDIALNNIRLAEQEELIQETYAYNYDYDYDEEDLGEYMGWEAGGYPSQDSRQQAYIYEDENSSEWTGWDGSYPNAAAA